MQGYNRGNYRSANNRLPVDPQQVDTRNFVQQTPVIRRIDLGDMNPFTQALVDALVIQIQDNAERSALRTFAFNYWGYNQFQENQFLELLQAYAAHVQTICMMQNADPVEVSRGEAEFFMAAASASLVETFPEITGYLPPEAEEAIGAALRDWHGIVRDIRAAQRQLGGGQQRASYQAGSGGGNRYGQAAQPGGFNRNTNVGGGMYGNRGGQGQQDTANLRPSWEQNRTVVRNDQVGGARSGFNSLQSSVRQNEPMVTAALERVEVIKQKQAQPQSTTRPAYGSRTAQVDPRPMDKITLQDGRVLIPAFLSGLKVTHSPTTPPLVHDRNTHMLFHVVSPDGTLSETIEEKTDAMQYLDHELDEKLKKIYKVNQGVFNRDRVEPNIILARKLIPNKAGTVATLVSEDTRLKLDAIKAPRQLNKLFRVTSLAAAVYAAKLEAARLPEESDLLEFQVEEVVRPDTTEGMLPHVLTLRRCTTYAEFQATIYDLHKDDKINDAMMEVLDKRMTAAFNRYNSKQLYLGLVVDSFMMDFEPLLDKVSSTKGEAVTALFLASATSVIRQACSVLTGEGLSEFLKQASDAVETKEPACFCDRYSVTQLPWTMYEMAHHWRVEGVVTVENAKPFHDALQGIFLRNQTNGIREHLLMTSDEKLIYAYKSPIMEGNFNITIEPPAFSTKFLERAVD